MIATIARELPLAMAEEGLSLENIYKAFKMPMPEEAQLNAAVDALIKQSLDLKLNHYTSINSIDKLEWDTIFAE